MGLTSSRNMTDGLPAEGQEPDRPQPSPHVSCCCAPAAHVSKSQKARRTLERDPAISALVSSVQCEGGFSTVSLSESLDEVILSDEGSSCKCRVYCDCHSEDKSKNHCSSSTDGLSSSTGVLSFQGSDVAVSENGMSGLAQQSYDDHASIGTSSGTRELFSSRQRKKQEDNAISASIDRRRRPLSAEVRGPGALVSDSLLNVRHADAFESSGLHATSEAISSQHRIQEMQERLRRYAGLPSLLDVGELERRNVLPAEAARRVRRRRMESALEMGSNLVTPEIRNNYGSSVESSVSAGATSRGRLRPHPRELEIPSNRDLSGDTYAVHDITSGLLLSSGPLGGISRGEVSGREARRNSGRRLWDALTRAASHRRDGTHRTFNDNERGSVLSHDRISPPNRRTRLHDGPPSGIAGPHVQRGRSFNLEERRRRFRSQVWAVQRLRATFDGVPGHARPCTLGVRHRRSQDSRVPEEANTRASISRIIMLAEALFEVLDEIHRQSLALSRTTGLSLGSLPAPDSVVDSLPVRVHRKSEIAENLKDDVTQCHICLVDYENGDQVRVLPCHHEYHMTCIDKWLRDIHRVCPLCRGDVCQLSTSDTRGDLSD